jgi:hypothetical protein
MTVILQGNITINCIRDPYNPIVNIIVSLPQHIFFSVIFVEVQEHQLLEFLVYSPYLISLTSFTTVDASTSMCYTAQFVGGLRMISLLLFFRCSIIL